MKYSLVLFDYGGVLAEEGFRLGLKAIAVDQGFDPERFFAEVTELTFSSGFVTGRIDEPEYWRRIRKLTGVTGTVNDLRREILKRFVLRPWMLDCVDKARFGGALTGILSDQCNWLDELNLRDAFFHHFDAVFNSFHVGVTKREDAFFNHALREMNVPAGQTMFIDDSPANIDRAARLGLRVHLYTDRTAFDAFWNNVESGMAD